MYAASLRATSISVYVILVDLLKRKNSMKNIQLTSVSILNRDIAAD